METEEKVYENSLRRKARRLGLRIRKSRVRSINVDDMGGYMIVDVRLNGIVDGSRFDLDIEDVADFLNNYERAVQEERKSKGVK